MHRLGIPEGLLISWSARLPILLLLCAGAAFYKTPAPVVTIRSAPEHPIIEVRDSNQFLNFDMIVRNTSTLTLRVSQIKLSVYDSAHQLALRKSLNTDAFAPSIAVIGRQVVAPGETLDVFNPFSEFDSLVPLTELEVLFLPAARIERAGAGRKPASIAGRLRLPPIAHR